MYKSKLNQQTLDGVTVRKDKKKARNWWKVVKGLIVLLRWILKVVEYFSSE